MHVSVSQASIAPAVGDNQAVPPAEIPCGAWPEPPGKAMIEASQQNAMTTARVKAFHSELGALLKRHEADVQHCLEVFLGQDAVLPPAPLKPRISQWSNSTSKPYSLVAGGRNLVSPSVDTTTPSSAAPMKENRPANTKAKHDDPDRSVEAIAHTMTYFGQRKKLRGQAQVNESRSDSLLRWVCGVMDMSRTVVNEPKNVGRFRERLRGVMNSRRFEFCVIALIFLDAVHLGWKVQKDAELRRPTRVLSDTSDLNYGVYLSLTAFFVVEWALRLFAEGSGFCKRKEWHWRFLDTFTVVSMLIEVIVNFAMGDAPKVMNLIQIFRVLRIVRVLRLIRVLRFFKDLRIMIESIANSMKSLMWVLIIMVLTFYVFGIVLTQGAIDYLSNNDLWDEADTYPLRKFFGSLDRSVLSLFQAMAGGISWIEVVDTLQPLPWLLSSSQFSQW